jgi:hypothetical protein
MVTILNVIIKILQKPSSSLSKNAIFLVKIFRKIKALVPEIVENDIFSDRFFFGFRKRTVGQHLAAAQRVEERGPLGSILRNSFGRNLRTKL